MLTSKASLQDIFTFHDTTFECIATGFRFVILSNTTPVDALLALEEGPD